MGCRGGWWTKRTWYPTTCYPLALCSISKFVCCRTSQHRQPQTRLWQPCIRQHARHTNCIRGFGFVCFSRRLWEHVNDCKYGTIARGSRRPQPVSPHEETYDLVSPIPPPPVASGRDPRNRRCWRHFIARHRGRGGRGRGCRCEQPWRRGRRGRRRKRQSRRWYRGAFAFAALVVLQAHSSPVFQEVSVGHVKARGGCRVTGACQTAVRGQMRGFRLNTGTVVACPPGPRPCPGDASSHVCPPTATLPPLPPPPKKRCQRIGGLKRQCERSSTVGDLGRRGCDAVAVPGYSVARGRHGRGGFFAARLRRQLQVRCRCRGNHSARVSQRHSLKDRLYLAHK